MTTPLAEAIAEVKQYPNLALRPETIQRVLTAAAAGQLIPKADAELAIALAYQRAGEAIDGANGHNDAAERRCKEAILALAPAEPLAEVQELRSLLNYATDCADRDYARAEAAEAEVARLREALTLIERVYYLEEKDAAWKIARMNGIAREAQDGKDLTHYKRIFPRAALTTPEKGMTE
jgi:hypothetical protein